MCKYCQGKEIEEYITPHQASEYDKSTAFVVGDTLVTQAFKGDMRTVEINVDVSFCPFCGRRLNRREQSADEMLKKWDYELFENKVVEITKELKYPYVEYVRYHDDKKTYIESRLTFDLSQDSICIHRGESKAEVFLNYDELEMLIEKARELGYLKE